MVAIICIPITALVVGFLVLKSVQLGLKWNVQVSQNKEPELKTPVSTVVDTVQEKKAVKIDQRQQEAIKEWFYGEGGEG